MAYFSNKGSSFAQIQEAVRDSTGTITYASDAAYEAAQGAAGLGDMYTRTDGATRVYNGASWSTLSSGLSGAGSQNRLTLWGASNSLIDDSDLAWDGTNKSINLGNLKLWKLQPTLVLDDNQSSETLLFSYNISTANFMIVEYSVERNGVFRLGHLYIATNGTDVGYDDVYVNTGETGVTFYASINGSSVEVKYTTTNSGFAGSFKHSRRSWN